ncbi:MAG: response regulator transcription factor, partial [Lachnospiraceae bacterium]|nr:response regulator transcription factor [Lachnospiraceae bacterium]
DFIILDLMLPGISGEEVCRTIREHSQVPILMLTAKTQEDSVIEGFGLGADDYVTKPFSVKLLYARMEAILRRVAPQQKAEEVLSFEGGLRIHPQRMEVWREDANISLTKSEWNILLAMARRPKKVFTRDELMEIVFGEDTESLDRVIDTHIKNLRKKIEANPKQPVYVKTVHGLGYKFGGESDEKNTP